MIRVLVDEFPGVHLVDAEAVWEGKRDEITLCARKGTATVSTGQVPPWSVCDRCRFMYGVLSR